MMEDLRSLNSELHFITDLVANCATHASYSLKTAYSLKTVVISNTPLRLHNLRIHFEGSQASSFYIHHPQAEYGNFTTSTTIGVDKLQSYSSNLSLSISSSR